MLILVSVIVFVNTETRSICQASSRQEGKSLCIINRQASAKVCLFFYSYMSFKIPVLAPMTSGTDMPEGADAPGGPACWRTKNKNKRRIRRQYGSANSPQNILDIMVLCAGCRGASPYGMKPGLSLIGRTRPRAERPPLRAHGRAHTATRDEMHRRSCVQTVTKHGGAEGSRPAGRLRNTASSSRSPAHRGRRSRCR